VLAVPPPRWFASKAANNNNVDQANNEGDESGAGQHVVPTEYRLRTERSLPVSQDTIVYVCM